LGVLFIFAPGKVEAAFHFQNLPQRVSYVIGLLGCVFAPMGIGYIAAALDPIRHVVWVQVALRAVRWSASLAGLSGQRVGDALAGSLKTSVSQREFFLSETHISADAKLFPAAYSVDAGFAGLVVNKTLAFDD
jgi:hypothetical protein